MEQFEIKELFPIKVGEYNIGFTNSSLCMVLSAVSVIAVFAFCLRKKTLIPGVAQSIPESIYEFIYKLVLDNVGKDGLKYFSFIFTLALFIAAGNLLGLFPYSFTFTSHLAAVGALSVFALLFNVFIGIKKKKWGYLRTFMPKGIPAARTADYSDRNDISALKTVQPDGKACCQYDGGAHYAENYCRFYRCAKSLRRCSFAV